MSQIIQIGEIAVEIIRKRAKHMYLRVRSPDGNVFITAPYGLSDQAITDFIQAKLDWIRRRKSEILANARPAAEFPPAAVFIWGLPRDLRCESKKGAFAIRLEPGEIVVSGPRGLDENIWAGLLGGLQKRLVEEAARPLIEKLREKLRLPQISFGVRRMKSRWGTCYPAKKRIILNSGIARHPLKCLEAVIAHELLHFFEPNHGRGFYERLDRLLPDWREAEAALNGR